MVTQVGAYLLPGSGIFTYTPMLRKSALTGLLMIVALVGIAQQFVSSYNPRLRNISDDIQLAETPDGGILVYGEVDFVDGRGTGLLTKLTQDNQPFPGFNTVYGDGWIKKVVVMNNGKLLVMRTVKDDENFEKSNLVRLHSDGTLDISFDAVTDMYDFFLQSNEKIVYAFATMSANGLRRVNADGSPDLSYTSPSLNFHIFRSAITADDKLYLASPTHLIRLTATGALDNTFPQLNVDNNLQAIKVHPNGNVILGGDFEHINGSAVSHVAILTHQGVIVPTFVPPAIENTVASIALKGDNIIIAGNLWTIGGVIAQAAELLPTGEVSQYLTQTYVGSIRDALIIHDKITLIGGYTAIDNVVSQLCVTQFNDDYSINTQFKPDITYAVGWDHRPIPSPSPVIDSHGRLTVFGDRQSQYKFLGLYDNATPVNNQLVRLNTNGSLHLGATVSGAISLYMYCTAIQPNNKLLIAGDFWVGPEKSKLVRLLPDGSLDPSFTVTINAAETIEEVVVSGSHIIVAGTFTNINGVPANSLAVLDFDGNVVFASTDLPPNASVEKVGLQPDGKILIHYYAPTSSQKIARLEADGALDATFEQVTLAGSVYGMVPDANGKIYLAGWFFDDHSGKGILRLNSNGSIDNTFQTGSAFGENLYPMAMIMLPNGKLMVGGNFTIYKGEPAHGLAVINTDGSLDQSTTSSFGFNRGTRVLHLNQRAEGIYATGRIIQDDFHKVTSVAKLSFDLPQKATNLAVTVDELGKVTLTWTDDSPDEDGFYVDRSDGTPYSLQLVGTVDAGITSYEETVDPYITYYYTVRPYNVAGASPSGGRVSILWNPLPPAPNPLTGSVSGKTVNLAWLDNSMSEIGYIVQRKEITDPSFVAIDTVASGSVGFTDYTAQYNKRYVYQVAALNAYGISDFSNTLDVSTLTFPNAPLQLLGSSSGRTIQISWEDNSDNETGFIVQRKKSVELVYHAVDTVSAGVDDFVDPELEYNTAYSYRVAALNEAGASVFSNTISLSTLTTPTAPTNLVIDFNDGEATLQWEDQSNNEEGFVVERNPGTGTFTVFATIETVDSEVFIDQSPELDETYSYRVAAYNAAGTSEFSNTGEISIVTGIESSPQIQFFPNPVLSSLTIRFETGERGEVQVFNSSGQKTIQAVKEEGQQSLVLPFGDASPGIYLVKVSNHPGSFKIIKQ